MDNEQSTDDRRGVLIQGALRLQWLTIAWMTIEGLVAIGAGLAAHSLLLLVFGIDSVIELASACVVIWRLLTELRRGKAFSEATEHRASRIAGALLLALACYVVAAAAWALWRHQGAEFSAPGFIVAIAAIPIMYVLSRRKLTLAQRLESRALRADAVEGFTCCWLSLTVVIGLAAQLTVGGWWVDSVASLAIVYFLVREGREAWNAEEE
jgi:divalent metal cation (Fe/Co/Zn/Cd) transporter